MTNPYQIDPKEISPEMVANLLEGKVVSLPSITEGEEYSSLEADYQPRNRRITGPRPISRAETSEEKRLQRRANRLSTNVPISDSETTPMAPNDVINSGTTPAQRLEIARNNRRLNRSKGAHYTGRRVGIGKPLRRRKPVDTDIRAHDPSWSPNEENEM